MSTPPLPRPSSPFPPFISSCFFVLFLDWFSHFFHFALPLPFCSVLFHSLSFSFHRLVLGSRHPLTLVALSCLALPCPDLFGSRCRLMESLYCGCLPFYGPRTVEPAFFLIIVCSFVSPVYFLVLRCSPTCSSNPALRGTVFSC